MSDAAPVRVIMTEPAEIMTRAHFDWFTQHYQEIKMFEYQLDWFDHFMANRWSILLAPRSHGKSLFMQCLLTYIICYDPKIRILIASDKEDLANQFSRGIQLFIEYIQECYPGDFPFLKDKPWKLTEWYLRPLVGQKHRFPTMKTIAGRASVTGRRFDILVFDDILQVENVTNEKMRRKLERWIRVAVWPTQDKGKFQKRLIIGTRKHPDDWYKKLINNPFYVPMTEVLYKEVDGVREYLWPYDPVTETGWNDEEVERTKQDYIDNPAEFYQEYFNLPSNPGGDFFKIEYIEDAYYRELPMDNRLKFYMGVDPSMGSTSKDSSWLAIAVIAFDYVEQKIYVVELYRNKMPTVEQADVITEFHNKWKPESTNIENCPANQYFSDQVREMLPDMYPINHREHRLRGTKDVNKEARIENIFYAYMKQGKIRFRHPDLSPMTTTFLEYEYLPFPTGDKDMLDALNMAVDRVQWKSTYEGPLIITVD